MRGRGRDQVLMGLKTLRGINNREVFCLFVLLIFSLLYVFSATGCFGFDSKAPRNVNVCYQVSTGFPALYLVLAGRFLAYSEFPTLTIACNMSLSLNRNSPH